MLRWLVITLLTAATVQPPPPPYQRQRTIAIHRQAYSAPACVDGAVFFAGGDGTCAAYELPSLNKKWSRTLPGDGRVGSLAVDQGTLYAATDPQFQRTASQLYALDARTGQVRWSVPRIGAASPIDVARGVVYLAMGPNTISAVDTKTRRQLWRHPFPAPKQSFSLQDGIDAITTAGAYVMVNCGNVTYCLDGASGRERWHQSESYMLGAELQVVGQIVVVPAGDGMVGQELRSGAVVWKDKNRSLSDGAGIVGRYLVGIDGGMLRAVDPKSGQELWSKSVGPKGTSGGNQYVAVVGNRIYARGIERAGIFTTEGRQQSGDAAAEALPEPFWSDGASLVCFDGSRLLLYRSGREPALSNDPAVRKRMAADLVRQFDSLDQTEISRLKSLGDAAFEPVLAALISTCAANDGGGDGKGGLRLYQKYHALAAVLEKVTTKRRTLALLDALKREKPASSARPLLLGLAAKVGDPAVVTPYFLEELKAVKTPGFELYESTSYVARQYVVRSKDPRAVAFLIDTLQNPKSDSTLRFEAYLHLAGSGDPNAVKAVLAERSGRTLLRPLAERVLAGVLHAGEFGMKTRVLGEKADAEGRTWGLLQSGVLGSAGDLWLAEKVAGNWTRPLFTGVSTSPVSAWAKPAPPAPRIAGKTGKELAAGDWLSLLTQNAELRQDRDDDGLTDLVETRLGTDAGKRDTDGDGDPDPLDPWPNAAARDLTDEEKVYAAVFEARFHFDQSEGPALLFAPEKLKPFEMPGRRGPTLWVASEGRARWAHPLEARYEQGVAFVSFEPADREKRGAALIEWNKDHTEATLGISVYFGGLNGTGYRARVRKIGEEWLVVALDQSYVS